MKDIDNSAFINLFKEACEKCFGHPLTEMLSETESKLLCNQLLEKTGLVIGPKSVKNYSAYVNNSSEAKAENPSVATLDTLARYVLEAPYTDEAKRKDNENHYPYWFEYRDRFSRSAKKSIANRKPINSFVLYLAGIAIVIAALIYFFLPGNKKSIVFEENFSSVSDEVLTQHEWTVQSKENTSWNRRNEKPGYLTLFTLKGDNWPDSAQSLKINNLLLRKIDSDCFTAEVHFKQFIPQQNWQQAGLLLLEDTTFNGKSVRISLAYNDFFGGYTRPKEILIQVITSRGKKDRMPEEVAHVPLFLLGGENETIFQNLNNTALRIEKHGNKLRFLSSSGSMENTAFKEIVSREIDIKPKYIGIFALKGFVDEAESIPVQIKFFRLSNDPCEN